MKDALEQARVIEKVTGEMLDIAEKARLRELVGELEDREDPDFAECAEIFPYVDQLVEFHDAIGEYIKKKVEKAKG